MQWSSRSQAVALGWPEVDMSRQDHESGFRGLDRKLSAGYECDMSCYTRLDLRSLEPRVCHLDFRRDTKGLEWIPQLASSIALGRSRRCNSPLCGRIAVGMH